MPKAEAMLEVLRNARRVGFVFGGGSARCAFQVGVVETLAELGVRASLTLGISGGVWNAAAVAVGNERRLRYYWRCFVRLPHLDLRNLLADGSPFLYARLHERTFAEYVGVEALKAPGAAPLWVGVTRLSDFTPHLFRAQDFDDPLPLLLASNYLPPFYTLPPRIGGVRYGDGALSDNLPYEKAFEEGCDAVVILANKGLSDGGLFRRPGDADHRVPPELAGRTLVIRPRHRLPVAFAERRWSHLKPVMELGRLRTRELLLGERHPETDLRGEAPPHTRLLWKAYRLASQRLGRG
jgi:predicted acylesterase/phospholipase RssA